MELSARIRKEVRGTLAQVDSLQKAEGVSLEKRVRKNPEDGTLSPTRASKLPR
jgi:hypothetical protein